MDKGTGNGRGNGRGNGSGNGPNSDVIQRPDDESIKPVSSLLSHFEGLKPSPKPKDDVPRLSPSPSTLRAVDLHPAAPPVRASFDLMRPRSPWASSDAQGDALPRTPLPDKRRSVSPPKSAHRRPLSMFTGSSPQLTPSVNVESPSSPPRSYFARNLSRSPERHDATPFGKVRDLITQHSSRSSTRPSSPGPDNVSAPQPSAKPPPINRADKPKILTIPTKSGTLPTTLSIAQGGLYPDQRRPSVEARVSPFNTPPSSDDNPSPPRSPPRPADISKSLKSVSQTRGVQPASTTPTAKTDITTPDSRLMGFQRASTGLEIRDPRNHGFSSIEPQPPSRESNLQPARANTVSERPSVRDPRSVGLSSQTRPQQRHVSENIRSVPAVAAVGQLPKISSNRDARAFGFAATTTARENAPEEMPPTLPARHTIKAPPRPPDESKNTTLRSVRQPSPVPDRSTKPGAPTQSTKIASTQITKAPLLPADSKFSPLPKRNTDDSQMTRGIVYPRQQAESAGYGTDSDDAEGVPEPSSVHKTEYPDATQTNRRQPYHKSGLRNIHIKTDPRSSDSRTYDVCGRFLCTAGFMTKVFDMVSGEQLTGINHGETVKASAVSFKPGIDLAGEGKRIWIGHSTGDLQEIDILTHIVIAENSSHNRREIVRILRHGRDLWTLDDDGKLFVWLADESGTPNLKYSHISHKVQRGHTFSLVAQDKLWLATGKEVRVYQPGNESNFSALTKPLLQSGAGEITCGTVSEEESGRVYFGHTDGRVTIYSTRDYACVGNVKASDYKINGLTVIENSLWAAYKTGKIYVYDITKSPWKVQKDWRAHEGPIVGLILDPRSIWTMQRLQITSLGYDGQARFWDGMLEEDWIEQSMQERDIQYCNFREIRAAVLTWNCGASTPYDLRTDFIADAIQSDNPPEILAFGFQEVVDLEDRTVTAKSIFGFGKKKDLDSTEQHQSRVYREWRDYLSRMISRYTSARYTYSELHTSSLVGLFQCIFIRQEERHNVRDVHATNIKCGLKGHYGNKGALVTRFVLDDSSLCFVNCHLAAGQTQTSHRNNDVTTILESENLPMEQDQDMRMSLFVGGGDGTQILDHEICILNGDLNYRIDTVPRDTVIKMIKANELSKLLERDQIMVSRRRVSGFRLASFVELPITFAPTYKYDVGTDNYDSSEKKRSPAWCDRILYRGPGRIKQVEYCRHEVKVSDHRPVSGLFKLRVKTIDSKKRMKSMKDCEDLFDVMTKRMTMSLAEAYLVKEYGMKKEEALRKLSG